MIYTITELKPHLIYITWKSRPNADESRAFIEALRKRLDEAAAPLYFISDLRHGQIVDVRMIQQLIGLTQHPHWAGSTAFSQNPISKLFLGSFHKMLRSSSEKNAAFDQPEEAVDFLEHLCPDLTSGLDWPQIVGDTGV